MNNIDTCLISDRYSNGWLSSNYFKKKMQHRLLINIYILSWSTPQLSSNLLGRHTVKQEIFACRKFSRISRISWDSRKFPAREYYLEEVKVFSFQRNFTESKSDNSKPCKWPFKVCMSCWVRAYNAVILHLVGVRGRPLIIWGAVEIEKKNKIRTILRKSTSLSEV